MSGFCVHCRERRSEGGDCRICGGRILPLNLEGDSLFLAGKYEFIEYLGKGAKGVVLRFRHRVTGKTWAVKYLFHDVSEKDQELFLNEVRCLGALNVPFVVGIADCDRDAHGSLYYIMEDFEGGSLADRLRVGSLDVEGFFAVFHQAIQGLAAIHSAGITHCDIKPSNILLSGRDGPLRVALSDFGISRRGEGRSGVLAGTPPYMAPQQFLGDDAPDNDVYSMGVTMWESLMGRPLFECTDVEEYERKHNTTTIDLDSVRRVGPHGPDLARLLGRCLAKDRNRRYAHATELHNDFDRLYVRYRERRQRSRLDRILGRVGVALSYPAFVVGALSLLPLLTGQSDKPALFVGLSTGMLSMGLVLRWLGHR